MADDVLAGKVGEDGFQSGWNDEAMVDLPREEHVPHCDGSKVDAVR